MKNNISKDVSKIIKYEFSETDNYIDITTRLCYMDDYNYNGFRLVSTDKTDEYVSTLVNTPVVAYYKKSIDDFTGHQVTVDKDGMKFGTQAVGTHIESWVQNDTVKPVYSENEVELPCIYGKARIWKSRFPKFYEVIKKRLEKDEMYTSWELSPSNVVNDEDVENTSIPNPRSCDAWEFLGNCLLGSSNPAYGENSKVLETSQTSFDLELSEALLQDIQLSEDDTNDNKDINKEIEQGGTNMAKNKVEQSALSVEALREKLHELLNPKGWSSNPYYSIWNIYPEEHKVLCRDWDKTDEQLMVYIYSIDENDEVTLGEGVETQLSKVLSERTNVNIDLKLDDTAKLLSQKEIKISELTQEVSTKTQELEKVTNELSEKVDAITKLGEEVSTLKEQVAELTPFKEKVEQAEAEQKEKELAEKRESLKKVATKGGYITEEELETSETLKKMIEEVDEKGIKAEIAERVIKKIDETHSVETSQKEAKPETASHNLNSDEDEDIANIDIMKMYLNK